jgi:hypothetical protein
MTDMLTGAAPTTNEGQAAATAPAKTEATPTKQSEQTTPPKQEAKATEQPKSESAPKAEDFTLTGEYDPGVLSTYTELAKSLNINKDNAQKILDQMAPAMKQAELAKLDTARAEWLNQSKNDPEFGGAKLEASLQVANKAYEALASPTLKELLKESGLVNHPEMVRLFRKAGEMISEDHFVGGKSARAAQVTGPRDFNSIAESFYKT